MGAYTQGGGVTSRQSLDASRKGGVLFQAPMKPPFPSQTTLGMIAWISPAMCYMGIPLVSSTQRERWMMLTHYIYFVYGDILLTITTLSCIWFGAEYLQIILAWHNSL